MRKTNRKKCCRLLPVILFCSLLSAVILLRGPIVQAQDTNLVTAIQTVAKQTIPAVVHIEVTERQEITNPLLPFENDPFFRQFFGNRNMPKKYQREVQGLGTGMIIDNEGHILTNYHVVGGANKIEVTLADGRRFTGKSVKLIGTDPKTDLAVIQIIEKGPLPHVILGDSDRVEVGQWVVAIGHPRGLDETVTQGIISAKHRRGISDPSNYQDYLQTDAAINPGNSGGPLLNLQGEVIGINSAILSESGGFEGLGFATPSNMASYISKELIASGKVTRGWLGVSIQDLTPELAQSLGTGNTKGALVADVIKGGPADQAGIKRGDVVTALQDKPIDDASSLQNAVSIATVGSNVKLTVVRNGGRQELTVKVGSLEQQEKTLATSMKDRYGISVRSATPQELERYGIDSEQGVVITAVNPGGPFGKAGFEKDDLILQVDNFPVGAPDSLYAALGAAGAHQKVTVVAVDHKSGQGANIEITLP